MNALKTEWCAICKQPVDTASWPSSDINSWRKGARVQPLIAKQANQGMIIFTLYCTSRKIHKECRHIYCNPQQIAKDTNQDVTNPNTSIVTGMRVYLGQPRKGFPLRPIASSAVVQLSLERRERARMLFSQDCWIKGHAQSYSNMQCRAK